MILLTGSSGFLGKAVLDKLLSAGLKVRCTYRNNIPFEHNDISWIKADLSSSQLPEDLMDKCSVVIHCAAAITGSRELLKRTNLQATEQLVALAEKARAKKFVFISSIDAVLFDHAYAQSKKEAEKAVKNSGLDWLIIRPSVIFGEQDAKNLAALNKLIKKLPVIPLPYNGRFKWQPVYVDDLAELIVNLSRDEQFKNKAVNAVGPEQLSFREIVRILQEHNHVRKMTLPLPGFIMAPLRIIAGGICSSFQDKLLGKGAEGQTIQLRTRLAEVYRPD